MRKLIKVLMTTVLVATLFVGCGSNQEVETTNTTKEVIDNTTKEVTDNTTKEVIDNTIEEVIDNTAVEVTDNTAEATETVSDKVYPYTYVDAAGREVAVEKEITRVATDYLPLWETLHLLGVQPVAATGVENYLATWDAFEGEDMGDVIDLGQGELNLELLLEVEPDVFLHQAADPSSIDIANYEAISQVVVFGPATKMDWKLSLREVGKLIGKEEKAEEVIAEFEQNIAAAREKLQAEYSGQTVLQISLMGEDRYFHAYRPVLFDKEVGLGLNAPEGHTSSENFEQVSMEAIVAMNPDYIFINVFDGDEAIYEAVQANSVWQSLKAVQSGNVTRIDGSGHASSGMAIQYTVQFIVDTLLAK